MKLTICFIILNKEFAIWRLIVNLSLSSYKYAFIFQKPWSLHLLLFSNTTKTVQLLLRLIAGYWINKMLTFEWQIFGKLFMANFIYTLRVFARNPVWQSEQDNIEESNALCVELNSEDTASLNFQSHTSVTCAMHLKALRIVVQQMTEWRTSLCLFYIVY